MTLKRANEIFYNKGKNVNQLELDSQETEYLVLPLPRFSTLFPYTSTYNGGSLQYSWLTEISLAISFE